MWFYYAGFQIHLMPRAWGPVFFTAEKKSESGQRALEGQYTHAYTIQTTTASYLVGKREQRVLFLFLNFDQGCQKASVSRTAKSPLWGGQPRAPWTPTVPAEYVFSIHTGQTRTNKIEKRKSSLIFAQCLIYFLPCHPSDIYKFSSMNASL